MGYVKAEAILPNSLLREIQKYIQGEYVYIPSENTTRKKWGDKMELDIEQLYREISN
jgi:hypothetical protein